MEKKRRKKEKTSLSLSLLDQLVLESPKMKKITMILPDYGIIRRKKNRKRDESFEKEREFDKILYRNATFVSFSLLLSLLSFPFITPRLQLISPLNKKNPAGLAQWQSTGLVNQGSRDQTSESA